MSGRWRIDPAEIGHARPSPDRDRRGTAARRSTIRAASARSTWCATDAARRASRPSPRWARSRSATRFDGAYLARGARRPRRRRSRRCCSTSGSSPGSATSMSARRCTWPGSRPARAGGRISRPRLDRLVEAIKDGAARGDRGRRLDASRLCPARRRARLFLEAMAGLWPRRASPAACGAPIRRRIEGGPLDLLLPALPALLRLDLAGLLA